MSEKTKFEDLPKKERIKNTEKGYNGISKGEIDKLSEELKEKPESDSFKDVFEPFEKARTNKKSSKLEGKSSKSDIGIKSELLGLVSSMVNLEEHQLMTIADTKNETDLEIYKVIRELRAKYMNMLIGNRKLAGQSWCEFKHMLGIAYKLTEVGTKIAETDNKKAIETICEAKDIYALILVKLEKN